MGKDPSCSAHPAHNTGASKTWLSQLEYRVEAIQRCSDDWPDDENLSFTFHRAACLPLKKQRLPARSASTKEAGVSTEVKSHSQSVILRGHFSLDTTLLQKQRGELIVFCSNLRPSLHILSLTCNMLPLSHPSHFLLGTSLPSCTIFSDLLCLECMLPAASFRPSEVL